MERTLQDTNTRITEILRLVVVDVTLGCGGCFLVVLSLISTMTCEMTVRDGGAGQKLGPLIYRPTTVVNVWHAASQGIGYKKAGSPFDGNIGKLAYPY